MHCYTSIPNWHVHVSLCPQAVWVCNGSLSLSMQGKPVGTPDSGAFFRVLSEHGCSSMFTAPTAIRAIRQQDTHSAIGAQYPLTRYPHHPIPTYWHNTAEMDHSTTVGASSVLYLFCPLEVGLPFIPLNVQGLGTFHPYPVLSPTG